MSENNWITVSYKKKTNKTINNDINSSSYCSYVAVNCPLTTNGRIVEEKPKLVKQYENYSIPLTFKLMKIGNYYIVRDKPDYWGATDEDIVMKCINKSIYKNGLEIVTYQMISNPDDYLEIKYIVTQNAEFKTNKFRRLPHDFWFNYKKYKKQICKYFYIDHVALTGIY